MERSKKGQSVAGKEESVCLAISLSSVPEGFMMMLDTGAANTARPSACSLAGTDLKIKFVSFFFSFFFLSFFFFFFFFFFWGGGGGRGLSRWRRRSDGSARVTFLVYPSTPRPPPPPPQPPNSNLTYSFSPSALRFSPLTFGAGWLNTSASTFWRAAYIYISLKWPG